MKKDIHPKYYPEAVVRCACGNTWTTGSTVPEVRTDVCSACHPFFTGEQRIVDSEGRVDRFYRRLRQAQAAQVEDVSEAAEAQAEEIGAAKEEASAE
jgi:large subunit ribosomal protein L31